MSDGDAIPPADDNPAPPRVPRPGTTANPSSLVYSADFIKAHVRTTHTEPNPNRIQTESEANPQSTRLKSGYSRKLHRSPAIPTPPPTPPPPPPANRLHRGRKTAPMAGLTLPPTPSNSSLVIASTRRSKTTI
jgi:hypothetical protein